MAGPEPSLHRFYIGNLPDGVTSQDVERFLTGAIVASQKKSGGGGAASSAVVTVERLDQKKGRGAAFAIVSMLTTLPPHLQYQGRKLTVQSATGGGFGSGSWAKPRSSRNNNKRSNQKDEQKKKASVDEDHQQSKKEDEHFVASSPPSIGEEGADTTERAGHDGLTSSSSSPDDGATRSFQVAAAFSTPQQPQPSLATLLADYGECDPNWQNMRVDIVDVDDAAGEDAEEHQHRPPVVTTMTTTITRRRKNILGLFQKAPVHINICTFGHVHGRPSGVDENNALSYDCDDYNDIILPCPAHLDFLDGQAGNVKRIMINAAVRNLASRDIAVAICDRLRSDVTYHGYGHHNPYQMTIYIASARGRHRSVILAELVATAVRQQLRNWPVDESDNEEWHCTVSVGCTHRDLHKKVRHNETARQKQQADEDESEIKARRLPQRAVRW
jgi:hypothetical protein